jgi:hypothetical protein
MNELENSPMLCITIFCVKKKTRNDLIRFSALFSLFTVMMPWCHPYLRFTDDSLKSTFQEQLSLMRKNRLFCDVILHVSSPTTTKITYFFAFY